MTKRHKIRLIKAREILDSRGNPTVKVYLKSDSVESSFSVPSGVSEGEYEALEIRDNGKRYFGKGVRRAVENINQIIAPRFKGENVTKQEKIDRMLIELDGTEQKSNLGANAILGVSIAVLKAAAQVRKLPLYNYIAKIFYKKQKNKILKLPQPSFLLIEGALHAGNKLQVQEFMIIPQIKSFQEKLRVASEIYHTLKIVLNGKYGSASTNVGYEGGFAPSLSRTEKALDLIMTAIKKAGYLSKIKIALDIAASTFYQKNSYKFEDKIFTGSGLLKYYFHLYNNYPIISLEDPFFEKDWEDFQLMTKSFKNKITIFGDDLLATNPKRIEKAGKLGACNGLLLKPDQIGTFSEAIDAASKAKENKWKIMVSHRSGDTCDTFISDFAVGIGADFIKSGAPARGERVAKYNRLLEIEEELSRGC